MELVITVNYESKTMLPTYNLGSNYSSEVVECFSQVIYRNCSELYYLRPDIITPSEVWYYLRMGWVTLDQLRTLDSSIRNGSVSIIQENGAILKAHSSNLSKKREYGSYCTLLWNTGPFLAHCLFTSRKDIDPYTTEISNGKK